MPVLTNPKHERFAQELAKGASANEAYILAGYAENDGNSIRLKGNERIAARLAELLDSAASQTETTVATLLKASWDIINKATSAEDFSAASATIERAAKIAGLWVDQSKSQSNSTVSVYSAEPMTAEEWEAEHAPLQ